MVSVRVQIPSRPFRPNTVTLAWDLKRRGYADCTIEGVVKRLRFLGRRVCLDVPSVVNGFIAGQSWSGAYKETMVNAYAHYVRYAGLQWVRPVYRRELRVPYVARLEDINKVIAAAGPKYRVIFSILRDTGLRPVELERLSKEGFDLEKGVVYPRSAKRGSARVLRLRKSTLAMLCGYVRRGYDPLFPKSSQISHMWLRVRNRLAKSLHEPGLKRIRLYDLRHHFATMLYHRTKDILLVKSKLGHRRIKNTMVYTHLVDFQDDEYVVRCAENVKQATALIEAGFEYVSEMDGVQLYRKRK